MSTLFGSVIRKLIEDETGYNFYIAFEKTDENGIGVYSIQMNKNIKYFYSSSDIDDVIETAQKMIENDPYINGEY